MNVRLLGPLEVRLEDGPVELGPRKQRAVLAMLALEPGRTVSADHLAEGLWGDEPPASAPKMVQLYISRLRRVLDGNDASIVTRGRGYELQLPEDGVDAVRFERLLDESRAREALALWRGEPLADLADEPFAAPEIRRLAELRLRASESAIDADLEAGRHAEVIGELDALVSANPLRERLHGQRMLALYRSGRQSEALEAYREARAGLVEEIGVEPGAELQRLHEQILAHDPALDLPKARKAQDVAEPSSPPPRRARHLLIGAAALLIAGITAFGIIRVLEPDGLSGIGENSVGLIEPDSGRITARYAVGRSPSAVVGGGGSIWVANGADGTVSRIDRGRDQPVKVIPVGETPAALAFGGGSLWVADSDSRTVWQVDPGSNKVVQPIEVGNAPRALAVAGGDLWVASGVDGGVRRIDLDRPGASRSIAVGANPSAMTAGYGALWVASEESGTVTRIAPRTGKVVIPIRVGNGPSALAVGEGGVWVVNRHDGTLARIDPVKNSVSWSVAVGRDPTAVAAGNGAVWVTRGDAGTVTRVDPDRPQRIETVKTGSSPAAIALAGGSVWAAAGTPEAAHRGGTLRVLVPRPADSSVPMDWLHWRAYTTWATAQLSSLAYDGLVAYRRVEGAAGATIVGALATNAPLPSPDGRTYTFTLRPGVRYSDGTLVRPEDFRASMERVLRAAGTDLPEFFTAIAGAPQCVHRPAQCDLSRGIETDASARTITIHLTRRDAEFMHKLTLPFAYVVPSGSPPRATLGRTPPGTGPYRVQRWAAKRGGVLVRNPHFRATLARPQGFADRIEISVRLDTTAERQIADVERGAADLAVIAHPFGSYVTRDRLRALLARAPGRLHTGPAPTTDWAFLNVRRRPFDDLGVRRAVNLAFDRSRVVALTGGLVVGRPACQVLPVTFPGYEPYCPYSAGPPDLARARRLVTASGRAGERVEVAVVDFRREEGRYLTRLLNRIGLRATQHVYGWNDYPVYNPGAREQTGFSGWAADYLAPSNFIETQFTCAEITGDDPLNSAKVCDPKLERLVRRARVTPRADAANAWAAAERRVMDLAVAVPMTQRRAVVLASERAGNVKHHGQWFTLLDQVWVR